MRSRGLTGRLGRGVLLVLVGVLAASGTVLTVLPTAMAADGVAADGSYAATRTLAREFAEADGQTRVVDERTVSVTVDKTRDLRGRERVRVSWSGARPSAGRAANPYGEGGVNQEYPVVVLQCRGTDDPDLPTAQRLRPETCWTSTWFQRSRKSVPRTAVWMHDLHASEADRGQRGGVDPWPTAEECLTLSSQATHLTPFEARNGTLYHACAADRMPPEAAVGAAFPPAEQAAFTDRQGNGSTMFEIRSDVENASLGCSSEVACSLVVIPIMGISCDGPNAECRKEGRFGAGASNYTGDEVDLAVSPLLWWSESNWRNRFSVPLTFGLPPSTCDIRDDRPPTGFYGSELLAQTALQWAPAYCLDQSRFKFQHNRMPDEVGFAVMERGDASAALVSEEQEKLDSAPVGYAPTALTGFGIGYVVDRPGNAGEFTDLKLSPRLIAKLLTQSYPASDLGRQRPGLSRNPLSINRDPEFKELNPGLDEISREAAATLLSLSESADTMRVLTSYLAADPDAMAFVAGKADPWGMTVNPAYRGIALPRHDWPLLDEFVPTTQLDCLQQNPAPYLAQVAAPVPTMRLIAEAVLDAWPNNQTRCERSTIDEPWKLGRVSRQGVGSRFMLGVVSLGDAARFGIRTAALQTKAGAFVGPTESTLLNAVGLAADPVDTADALGPARFDQERMRAHGRAYPGTMVVYTAAKLSGLEQAEAAKVAQFIRVAIGEGQRPGPGNGQLAEGFVPIRATGATARLHARAQQMATAIERQQGITLPAGKVKKPKKKQKAVTEDPPGQQPSPETPAGDTPELPEVPAVPDAPEAEDPAAAAPPSTVAAEAAVTPTSLVESVLAKRILPLLLLAALLGGGVAAGTRIALRVRGSR